MKEIILENSRLRLAVNPNMGFSILAFFAKKNGAWLPIMPDAREKTSGLERVRTNSASFIMVPYSNRIENGVFSFAGKTYELRQPEEHAIHGDVRYRPWTVKQHSDHIIGCEFNSADCDDMNWPWAFRAYAEYRLEDNTLVSYLSLTNEADADMPAGCGWHPFFNRSLTRDNEPVYLCIYTEKVYPDANNNRIPSGPAQNLPANQNFSKEKQLTMDNFIDACFYGYDGNGYVSWPESEVKMTFKCSPSCNHLVMYNPPEPFFAIEPVTNATNGFNLHNQGDPTSGVVILKPQETLAAEFKVVMEM